MNPMAEEVAATALPAIPLNPVKGVLLTEIQHCPNGSWDQLALQRVQGIRDGGGIATAVGYHGAEATPGLHPNRLPAQTAAVLSSSGQVVFRSVVPYALTKRLRVIHAAREVASSCALAQ